MGNALTGGEYSPEKAMGISWPDTSDDEEEEGPLLDAAAVGRQSAGGSASAKDSKSQQSQKPSEKASEKPSEKPSAKTTEKQAADEIAWTNDHDLCGIEDGPPWEGPQRIKTSPLDAAKKQRFQEFLDKLFCRETILGKKVIFEPDVITEVIEAVIPLLQSEPMLIEDVPFDVTIVGDIHGQFYDLNRIFLGDSKDGKPGWECMKYVFLGDYIDRGRQSIEVMMALFIIKCMHPDRVFLLRGNHEFYKVNKTYGFWFDFCDQYTHAPTAKYLYLLFNEAFTWMSIAAIVGNSYFCSHGGISTSCFNRRHMRGLYKPVYLSSEDNLIMDITWSDPAAGLRGTAFNKDRKTSFYFGFDELCKGLASMEVVAIFRGHTHLTKGYAATWNCFFTLFSATNYEGHESAGSVAYVGPTGRVQIWILEPDPNRTKWEQKLAAIEFLNYGNEDEEGERDTVIDTGGAIQGTA